MQRTTVTFILLGLLLIPVSSAGASQASKHKKKPPKALTIHALTKLARKRVTRISDLMARGDFPAVCKQMQAPLRKHYSKASCRTMTTKAVTAFADSEVQVNLEHASSAVRGAAEANHNHYPSNGLTTAITVAEPELQAENVTSASQLDGKPNTLIGIDTGRSSAKQVVLYADSQSGTVWELLSTITSDKPLKTAAGGGTGLAQKVKPTAHVTYFQLIPHEKKRTFIAQADVRYSQGGSEKISFQIVQHGRANFQIVQLDSQMLRQG